MKKILLTVAVALMSVATLSAQSLKDMCDAGIAAFNAKDYQKAAEYFEGIIAVGAYDDTAADQVATAKSNLPKAWYQLGGRHAQAKDFAAARPFFVKAAEAAELYDDVATMNRAKTWVGKTYELEGGGLFNDKNYAAALPIFEAGFASDPRNTKMANWLGTCYCETGRFDEGMAVFAKVSAMGTNPRYAADADEAKAHIARYTNNRVAQYMTAKDYDGIISFANSLLAADANNATAAKVRMQAYYDKKDYATVVSIADATASVQTSPEEVSNVYFIVGAAYNAQENKSQAIAAFRKVTAGANAATAKAIIAELSK
ncbi:MAG: tetratricopeptide repeat protein [Rikenellaceae bacterium]